MTRTEHLLTILAEEANEVAQRASKALRFSLEEVQPGQERTNLQRIDDELQDLLAVYGMLTGLSVSKIPDFKKAAAKQTRVQEYLAYSKKCGTVTPEPDAATELEKTLYQFGRGGSQKMQAAEYGVTDLLDGWQEIDTAPRSVQPILLLGCTGYVTAYECHEGGLGHLGWAVGWRPMPDDCPHYHAKMLLEAHRKREANQP